MYIYIKRKNSRIDKQIKIVKKKNTFKQKNSSKPSLTQHVVKTQPSICPEPMAHSPVPILVDLRHTHQYPWLYCILVFHLGIVLSFLFLGISQLAKTSLI